MKVRVEFQAYLDQYSPNGDNEFTYDAPEGSTIGDMLRKLQVPPDLSSVLVVGENAAEPGHVLAEGERITVIPPVAGGTSF
jgi:molybdopterin converting factor small subunit